jgi:7,8-dihydropterin-6-yl-methyl-4-(beta-D-ribofuranosyl)aminobenzene 5'-phosphate synthase
VFLYLTFFKQSLDIMKSLLFFMPIENEMNDNKHQKIQLTELTSLTVINIVDNETDGMSSSCACIRPIPNNSSSSCSAAGDGAAAGRKEDKRVATYTQEFTSRINDDHALDMNSLCHAAHGLSLLLIAEYEEEDCYYDSNIDHHCISNTDTNVKGTTRPRRKRKCLLLDGGPDPELWIQNAMKCNIPLQDISTVVLSHYHIDHSNGLRGAVSEIVRERRRQRRERQEHSSEQQDDHTVMVDLHQSEIISRGVKVRGKIYPMKPCNPIGKDFIELGARVSLHKDAHVVEDCFYISGDIPRRTTFETGLPGHFRQIDSKYRNQWVPDEEIRDERYVACKIRGRGVVVFSACSHAGVVNVCMDAMDKLESKLTAVIGGFHLAGSSVEDRIGSTVEALKEMNPELLLAGHCTGWKAKAKLSEEFPYNFQSMSVGGFYKFNSM